MPLSSIRFCAALICIAVAVATPLSAQQGSIAFKGLKANGSQPVEITADGLSVDEKAGTAIFTGNILLVQGELRLSSDQLLVNYLDGDRRKIDRVTATGNVLLSTPSEAAKGQQAVYSLTSHSIEMTGNVVLTQNNNVMQGQKLNVDLTSGTGQMSGRVKTVLQPAGN